MKNFFLILALTFITVSCSKDDENVIDPSTKELSGTWSLKSMHSRKNPSFNKTFEKGELSLTFHEDGKLKTESRLVMDTDNLELNGILIMLPWAFDNNSEWKIDDNVLSLYFQTNKSKPQTFFKSSINKLSDGELSFKFDDESFDTTDINTLDEEDIKSSQDLTFHFVKNK